MGDERREDSMVANFVLFRFLLKVWFTKSSENYQAQNLGKLYAKFSSKTLYDFRCIKDITQKDSIF